MEKRASVSTPPLTIIDHGTTRGRSRAYFPLGNKAMLVCRLGIVCVALRKEYFVCLLRFVDVGF